MLGTTPTTLGFGLGGLLPVQGSLRDGRASTHGHTRGEGTVDGGLLLLRLWKAFLQLLLKVFPVVEEDSLGLGLILLVHGDDWASKRRQEGERSAKMWRRVVDKA